MVPLPGQLQCPWVAMETAAEYIIHALHDAGDSVPEAEGVVEVLLLPDKLLEVTPVAFLSGVPSYGSCMGQSYRSH